MSEIVQVGPVDLDRELARLAHRHRAASGAGIGLLNAIGARADTLLDRLPAAVRARLTQSAADALHAAMSAAETSRAYVPDQRAWVNTAVTTALGAAGGAGGLPSALAEIPVTTAMLFRVIAGAAAQEGFDPGLTSVKFDCVQVFATAGPLDHDDSTDIAFVTTRLALSGTAIRGAIARVAPRLGAVLGQKLAAQSVPILGAAAGAATNFAYTRYYRDMAHVHFGLRRLEIDAEIPHPELLNRFKAALLVK